jgi:hypothetical protein
MACFRQFQRCLHAADASPDHQDFPRFWIHLSSP